VTAAACASTLPQIGTEATAPPARLSHDDVIQANTGWKLEPWEWAASEARRAVLQEQTEVIADLLEQAGVRVRQESDVVAISAVTGIVTPIQQWRPVRILPAVAARDRRPMLHALRYWIERVHPREHYLRYGVVTAPEPVPAFGPLRDALQDLARTISKWAHEAGQRYGIKVHFRGTEFTRRSAADRGMTDQYPADTMLYHVHANLLYEPTRLLGERGWSEFLAWSRQYFGAHWHDAGRVGDVRELVKYVVKPAELTDGPRPLDPAEAKWLFESLFRLNLAQPMGGFRDFWKGLAEAGQKVVTVRAAGGKRVLRVTQKATRLDHSRRADSEEARKGVPANLILGVTLPMWSHTPWAEPMILVQRYQPGAVGEAAMERLREIDFERMYARQLWDESGAPDPRVALAVAKAWRERGSRSTVTPFRAPSAEGAYRVHTSSLTVRPEGTGREAAGKTDPPDPPPDGGQVVLLERPGGPPIDLGAADIDIPEAS